jgi:hypothetical protein
MYIHTIRILICARQQYDARFFSTTERSRKKTPEEFNNGLAATSGGLVVGLMNDMAVGKTGSPVLEDPYGLNIL